MTRIKSECQENAAGMLRGKQSRFLGWIGDIRYYMLDGKVWSLTLDGRVAHTDDDSDRDQLLAMVSHFNQGVSE